MNGHGTPAESGATAELEALLADGVDDLRSAVAFSKLSRPELYRRIKSGELRSFTVGRRRLIARRELVRFLAAAAAQATRPPEDDSRSPT